MFDHNSLDKTKPLDIYLSRPSGQHLGKLNGINKARLHMYLKDAWEIEFEVDKYISEKPNKIYDYLLPFMEIFIDTIGWFRINTLPTENEKDGRVYKTFTAYGIETQLSDLDINLMHANCGTDTSLEMFDKNVDAFGRPKRSIQFYIRNADDDPASNKYWGLGLLNILERNYFSKKGWSIGEVSTSLLSIIRSFEIDSVDGFSFLMGDCANAFQCIFTFDRTNKKIHATPSKDFGKSLNIECSFRNLLNSVTITDRRDKPYTKFAVQGANTDTTITYVNFGKDTIENLSYALSEKYASQEIRDKYDAYTTYRESRRNEYTNTWTEGLKIQSEKDELINRYPVDEVTVKWNAYELKDLYNELSIFTQMKQDIEETYTINGVLQVENSPKYALYLSIKDVIIPDIQTEIARQEAGSATEATKVDYKFNWDLYGINGLKERKTTCNNIITTLSQAGYDKPPGSESDTLYKKQHEQYLKMVQAVKDIDARLAVLNAQVDTLQKQLDTISAKRAQIVKDVDIANPSFGFTDSELSTIETLYSETGYKDSSIEVIYPENVEDIIKCAWKLLKSAKEELEIECRPQVTFSITMDNIYHIDAFKKAANKMENGDFIYLELDGGYKTKQRIIEIETELVNFNDMDLRMTFSDMTSAYGKYDDLRFLKDQSNASSKNNLTRDDKKYVSNIANSAANNVLNQYFSGAGTIFPNGLSQEDTLMLSDVLSGLVQGNLTLEELKVKLAKIDSLETNSAFAKYLEAVAIAVNSGRFDSLDAAIAKIDTLLAGNITSENIKSGSVTTDRLKTEDGWITHAMIAQGAIETAQIADGSITDAKIVGLTANKITAGKLDAAQIEVVNLNAANITVGTINGQQIAPGAIDLDKLGSDVTDVMNDASADAQKALADAVEAYDAALAAQTAAGSAQATADGKNTVFYQTTAPAVTGRKKNDIWYDTDDGYKMYHFNGSTWVADTFGTSAITNGSISSDKITDLAVTSSKLDNLSVTNAKLGNLSVTNSKLDNLSVTNSKLDNLSVTNAKIADATIESAKIKTLDAGKITTGTLSADRIAAGSLAIGKLDSSTQGTINTAKNNAQSAINQLTVNAQTKLNGLELFDQRYNSDTTCKPFVSGTYTIVPATEVAGGNTNSGNLIKTISAPYLYTDYIPVNTDLPFYWSMDAYNLSTNNGTIYVQVCFYDKNKTAMTTNEAAITMVSNVSLPSANTWHTLEGWSTVPSMTDVRKKAYYARIRYMPRYSEQSGTTYIRNVHWKQLGTNQIGQINAMDLVLANWCYNNDKTYINGGKIYTGTVSANQIAANAVIAGKIAANAVTAGTIAANAVTSGTIAANSVTVDKLAANAVTTEKIAANAITSDKIVAGAITAAKLAAKTITANELASNSVTAEKIVANAVTADKIVAGAITSGKIAAKTITTNEIATNAVTTDKIVANAVVAGKIATNAVTAGTIAANAVTVDKLAANSVTTDKIASRTITTDKIKVGAITANEIAAGTITADKIKASAITTDKLATDAIKSKNYQFKKAGSLFDLSNGKLQIYDDGYNALISVNHYSTASNDYDWTSYFGSSGIEFTRDMAGTIGEFQSCFLGPGALSINAGPSGSFHIGTDGISTSMPLVVNGVNIGNAISTINNNLAQKLSLSGGTIFGKLTVNGELWAGSKALIWTDAEGGNLSLIAPDGTRWEMDAFNGNFRIFKYNPVIGFTFDKNGTLSLTKDVYASCIYTSYGFKVNANNTNGYMFNSGAKMWSPSGQHLYWGASNEAQCFLHLGVHDSRWALDGDVNNVLALGTPNHRWTQLYAVSGSINTSDRNAKEDITAMPSVYEDVFMDLKPVSYRFKDGTSGRTHTGFISQDMEDTLKQHGLTTTDWAAVCKDKSDANDSYVYGLRYEEIIALNTHMIQKLYTEIDALKAQILELKELFAFKTSP